MTRPRATTTPTMDWRSSASKACNLMPSGEIALEPEVIDSEAQFEPIRRRTDCRYCNGTVAFSSLPPPIDAVICISTRNQPDRTRRAADHFHEVGLCRDLWFYRPMPGSHVVKAIWTSHHAVATYALARGFRSVVMLEDDATFRQPWPKVVSALAAVVPQLPPDWRGLYLGHFPLQGYFVRSKVMRVRSGCTHSYLAGPLLLRWLADHEPKDPSIPIWEIVGSGLDAAFAHLPGMYALFPMVATQRFMGQHRADIDPQLTREGKRRKLTDKARYRELMLYHGMPPAEWVAALLSPIHWLTRSRWAK